MVSGRPKYLGQKGGHLVYDIAADPCGESLNRAARQAQVCGFEC